MLRIVISRLLLVALPFAVYFLWRAFTDTPEKARRATPWAWLTAAGLVLVGLSLMATAVFHADNRAETYVPAEAHPGGTVTPGGFRAQDARP